MPERDLIDPQCPPFPACYELLTAKGFQRWQPHSAPFVLCHTKMSPQRYLFVSCCCKGSLVRASSSDLVLSGGAVE